MATEDWKEIEIQVAGRLVKGKYSVFDRHVTVAAWSGTKTARLGVLPAERLATMLLRELASEGDQKSWAREGTPSDAQRTS